MPKRFKKNKEKKNQKHCEQENPADREDLFTVLHELDTEEHALLQEKRDLLNIEQELQLRINEEIDGRKHRIEALKTETVQLKCQCEKLTSLLNIPVPK